MRGFGGGSQGLLDRCRPLPIALCFSMNWDELKEVASWGQYVHWAQLNVDRWICADDHTPAESVATSFQFFASMYVAIEGWEQLKLQDAEIERILENSVSDPNPQVGRLPGRRSSTRNLFAESISTKCRSRLSQWIQC